MHRTPISSAERSMLDFGGLCAIIFYGDKNTVMGDTMTILLLGSGQNIKQTKKCVQNYLVGTHYENILIKHCNGLKSFKSRTFSFDLLITALEDIHKEERDPLAEIIRENNAATVIITDKDDCPVEYLALHIIDRVSKANFENDLCRVMDDYFEGHFADHDLFRYNVHKSQRIVNRKQILFLQSDGKRIIIYTQNGQDTFYGKLSDCVKQPCMRDFVFIHQSYLVNPFFIDEIRNGKVYIGKWELPISRKYSQNIRELAAGKNLLTTSHR